MEIKKNILVIEVSLAVWESIKERLEDLRYDVISAQTGKDGIERAKADHPDLVVIDGHLPDMDSFEICRQIRLFAHPEKIKIIVMTASLNAMDAVKARKAGADDYVLKTMDLRLLEASLREAFERKDLRDESRMKPEELEIHAWALKKTNEGTFGCDQP
jgi:DNA-binding response OmpR family regulator